MNSVSRSPSDRLRIIILGYIVRGPLGGMTWSELQYLVGLAKLGHDVYFIEDSDDYPSCYDPSKNTTDTNPTYGLKYAANILEKFGMRDSWAYYDAHTMCWHGPCAERIPEICKTGDLLINLGGVNPIRAWFSEIPVRIFIDKDPLFTQIRNLTDAKRRDLASQHTVLFSFGENIGCSHCSIPDDGLPWHSTRHPVVVDEVRANIGPIEGKFTTVMQWDSYPAREYNGRRYGMKSESFADYINLPEEAGSIFELAVGSPSAPRDVLRGKGWTLCNPLEISRDPWTYQRYIQESKAEFSVAKHGYVITRSGWFSERSATYLASGRPVVVQESGFSDWLPSGAGILSFSTPDEALAGIEDINSRYEFHCGAARAVAEEYFDSRKVLRRLVECAMNAGPAPSIDLTESTYS